MPSTLPGVRAARRAVVVAMVPAGTIGGHVLGYLMAGEDAALHGAHSHLRPAAWVALAATAAALACVALVRSRPGRERVPLCPLVAAQVGLFAVVEAGEHALTGHGAASVVTDPSFRWGVLAQLLSGAVLVLACRVARVSGDRVRALLARRRVLPPPRCHRAWGRIGVAEPRVEQGSAVSGRGPPRLVAAR